MKIFDKLKNALFEEEYVEVEEKPKKDKKKKVEKKETREYYNNYEENERPVAKRIVPQEKKNIDILEEEEGSILDNVSFRDQDLIEAEAEPKIAMVSEEDLISDDTIPEEKFEPVKRRSDISYEAPKEEYLEVEKEETKLYQNSKKESFYDNYIPHAYGNYEKQREKSKEGFKPSPVISPIYGIVADDSYEEQPRREVRITTPVKSGKMNIEDIRKKAFGQYSEETYDDQQTEVIEENNTLVDLSDDSKTPEVSSITMGDAMEYFEDLGLEYNNDYIDRSKMNMNETKEEVQSSPIKITDNTMIDEDEEEKYNTLDDRKFTVSEMADKTLEEPIIDDKEVIVTEKVDDQVVEDNDSDNLFDLIDSMYE